LNEKFLVFGNLYTKAGYEDHDDEHQQVVVLDTRNGSLTALEKTKMKTHRRIFHINTLMINAFVCGENGISKIRPEMVSERFSHDEDSCE
jgi:hypothetical protein